MAQKSILSFFKVPVYSKTSDSEKRKEAKAELKSSESGVGSDECSPVKKTNKRKVKCIESDDESEEIQNVNENNSKGIDTRLEENEKSVENVSTQKQEVKECTESVSKKPTKIIKIAKEVDEILLNESLNGGKLSVEDDQINNPKIKEDAFDNLKVIENGVKEDSLDEESKSPTKMEIDNLHTGEKNLIDGSKSTEISGASESRTVSEPSSSNHTVFIPRRKTARKSTIRPPAQCDWYVSKLKEQKDVQEINCVADVSKNDELSISEKLENETKKLKCEVTEISDNAEIDTGTQKSVHKTGDSKALDNIEENSKLNSETKSSKQYTTKPNSDKKDKLNTEKSPNKMFVNTSEDSKKSGSNKNKPKRGQKKDAVSKNSSASIANFFITVKEKNENVSKEISKDVAEETCQNTDINEEKSTNNCDEVKKPETKIEMNESSELEQEDSPIKKGSKRGKKTQCIDSDDDEEVVSPKKADNEDENKSETTSKEVQNDNVSEEEKASDEPPNEKSSATKAETEVNSKSKFGCKSTSSGTVYNPSKNRYHPIEDACWKQDEKVPYLALAKTMELIENITGRLKIIEILANFFRSVIVLSPNDLLQSVYLCLNRLAPEYEGIELGVGETLLMRAVAQATGRTFDKIKAEVAIKGDLGLVSENSRGSQRLMFSPPKLTVASVFSKFLEIAKMSGNAVMAKKIDKIQSLFVACRDCEAKYIIRSLSGKLRIGLAEQSVLSAIARAAVLTPPGQTYPPEIIDASKGILENSFKELLQSQTLILKTAYCECPNYDLIIPVLLKEGISALPKCCQLSPGRPLKPMLAHPTTGIDIVLERFDKNAFTCEFKYDGERAQIHMTDSGEVKIFSRNQEDNTSKYPDIISRLPNAVKESTKSFILDSEAVAWDKENHQILPFQVLSTRKRKDAVESEIVVQVCIMVFDLLYLNGESLIKKPLKERRSLLHSSFNAVENEFMFAQFKDGNSAETMQEFLDESVKGNCEGLMVKALEVDASYEIAKRSHNWLKLKKDYLQGVGDTIDLVVIGGYFGKGKRTGSYGGFLLACYDEDNEEFQSICKLGTGFKDDDLEAHSTFFKQHIISGPKSYYRYDHSLEPDVWFEAVQVWEIKCADLSISPVHKAAVGIVDPEKGVSLRFPRFVRIRDDKNSENATNSTQIADMYQKQEQIQNTSNKNNNAEEDFY